MSEHLTTAQRDRFSRLLRMVQRCAAAEHENCFEMRWDGTQWVAELHWSAGNRAAYCRGFGEFPIDAIEDLLSWMDDLRET